MKQYKVKEIYYTIQGEGYHTGRPAVFCRFSGCNLWSGREEDRHKAICKFCDTDFWGTDGINGGSYSGEQLVTMLKKLSPAEEGTFVVFTGGEPALQLDNDLISLLKAAKIESAIETNGTIALPEGIDWVCVSPKADTDIIVSTGNELKLVYPQIEHEPNDFEGLIFDHYYLQPLENDHWESNTEACIEYCKAHPKWKLSVQTHKFLNIP